MDYQLVLQSRRPSRFDALVNLEDKLQELIEPIAEVDGHDMGSGEANIFFPHQLSRLNFLTSQTAAIGRVLAGQGQCRFPGLTF